MTNQISAAQWQDYETNGFLRLGKLLSDQDLAALQQRIDDIMMGVAKLDYNRLYMQLDSQDGKYGSLDGGGNGFKTATLDYRKIQNLEFDDLFRAYVEQPIFREISDYIYGPETQIACFRAMFMNKPAHKGTVLPWHQDAWAHLDRQPVVTLWTALDPATIGNGCVQVVRGTHKLGRINPAHGSGFLNSEQAEQYCSPDKVEFLELAAGECVLLHNWLLHSSDVNKTDIPRRAFSVCYMDAETVASNGEKFTRLFEPALV